MVRKTLVAFLFAFMAICVHSGDVSQKKSTKLAKVSVERKQGFPDVEDFFKNFVIPRVPVVLREEIFVLVPDFGETDLAISPLSFTTYIHAKKRSNENANYHMSVRQFLKRYRKEKLYLDEAIPTSIKSFVRLPRCLLCPAVFDELLSTRLFFHQGKYKGGLLATERNFLGCQVTGSSEIHFFSPVTFPEHGSEEAQNERKTSEMPKNGTENKIYLNMDKPNQTYFAELKAGDCVYIPALWLHQWTTSGKAVTVGVYWSNKTITPTSSLCGNQSEVNALALNFKDDPKPDLESLFMFDNLLHFIKNYFLKNEEESMTFETFEEYLKKDQKYMEDLVEWNSECNSVAKEMFQQMDANDDGFLSLGDFDKLSYKDLKDMAGKTDDRLEDFEDIFEDQKDEQKGPLFDVVKNPASDYESEFRNMIDEEFDEIFLEMENASKAQKDQKAKHALKDYKTVGETVPEEFQHVENEERQLKETSQKTNDNGATEAKENSEVKTDAEPKDEL